MKRNFEFDSYIGLYANHQLYISTPYCLITELFDNILPYARPESQPMVSSSLTAHRYERAPLENTPMPGVVSFNRF